MAELLEQGKCKQKGFTLIELMVVLVIIAVMTTVAVMTLSPSEQGALRSQQHQIKQFLALVRDQASFDKTVYLVAPSETQAKVYQLQQGQWETAERVQSLTWQSGLVVQAIQLDTSTQWGQPQPGWLFWPSGEVSAGEIYLLPFSARQEHGAIERDRQVVEQGLVLKWDALLRFEPPPNAH